MPSVAVLTSAFLRFKLSRVLGNADGRDGSPIKNDYSFLINRNGRFDAKTYKRVCILPVGDDANHTERVWNFYGTVTQANPLVPWTTSFVSGETRTADGVNVVGLEIKTGNYACK